jgi:hypothetical protein
VVVEKRKNRKADGKVGTADNEKPAELLDIM